MTQIFYHYEKFSFDTAPASLIFYEMSFTIIEWKHFCHYGYSQINHGMLKLTSISAIGYVGCSL